MTEDERKLLLAVARVLTVEFTADGRYRGSPSSWPARDRSGLLSVKPILDLIVKIEAGGQSAPEVCEAIGREKP